MTGRVVSRGGMGVLLCVAALVVMPLVLAPRSGSTDGVTTLSIITPHNEQIRYEFARAFRAWHQREYHEAVGVQWLVPGGTAVIQHMLEAQYTAALVAGDPPGGRADLLFGGGTQVHSRLARPLSVTVGSERVTTTITVPLDFDPAWLESAYGPNDIGGTRLYDDRLHWFGTALSSFGIVYNLDALRQAGVPEPRSWADLADPSLRGWVVLANPDLSGSVATAFVTILNRRGWSAGWAILRRAGANSRAFPAAAIRAPLEVGRGDAAAGICIDFFGRSQSQSLRAAGITGRVGYIDPPGATTIDPDPVSVLRGALHPELARRFVEFCLSEAGQSLWQFAADAGIGDGLGPHRFELRRLPVARFMYERHFDRFVDRVNPYLSVTAQDQPDPFVRTFVPVLFSAMVIDNDRELRDAWRTITAHPAYPDGRGIVTASDVDDPLLGRMLALFDAMPQATGPAGETLALADVTILGRLAEACNDAALWPPHADPIVEIRIRFARFFRDNYRAIVDLGP